MLDLNQRIWVSKTHALDQLGELSTFVVYIKVLKEELETITRRCPHNPFLTRMKRIGHRTVTRRRKPSMALRNGVEPLTFWLTVKCSANWANEAYHPCQSWTGDTSVKEKCLNRLTNGRNSRVKYVLTVALSLSYIWNSSDNRNQTDDHRSLHNAIVCCYHPYVLGAQGGTLTHTSLDIRA